jgi:hypothetical protein
MPGFGESLIILLILSPFIIGFVVLRRSSRKLRVPPE